MSISSSSCTITLFFFISRFLRRLAEKRAGRKAKKAEAFRGSDCKDQLVKGIICEVTKKKLLVRK